MHFEWNKMIKIKQEEDLSPPDINDHLMAEWSEETRVEKDVKVEFVPNMSIKEEDEENYYESSDDMDYTIKTESTKDTENALIRKSRKGGLKKRAVTKLAPVKLRKHIDTLIEKLCQGAPVSDSVSSQCIFKCYECDGKTFSAWNTLRTHRFRKQCSVSTSTADIGNLVSKAVCHICKICSAKILCDKNFIQRHLHLHKIGILEYAKKFACKKTEETIYSQDIIGNLCLYECIDCGYNSSSGRAFLKHKRLTHHCRKISSLDSLKKSVYHRCKLCKKSILCDQTVIAKHLRRHHDFTPEDYCKITGASINKNPVELLDPE